MYICIKYIPPAGIHSCREECIPAGRSAFLPVGSVYIYVYICILPGGMHSYQEECIPPGRMDSTR